MGFLSNAMISVKYELINTLARLKAEVANKSVISCDFEVASLYDNPTTRTDLEGKMQDAEDRDFKQWQHCRALLQATGLSHPSLTWITHLNIGLSDRRAVIFVFPKNERHNDVLEWLVEANIKTVWHNAVFDLGRLYHVTKKFPKDYEDTLLLYKCLHNHSGNVGQEYSLKQLMGKYYGEWAVAKEDYGSHNLYDVHFLKYCAIDACATYKLWQQLNLGDY